MSYPNQYLSSSTNNLCNMNHPNLPDHPNLPNHPDHSNHPNHRIVRPQPIYHPSNLYPRTNYPLHHMPSAQNYVSSTPNPRMYRSQYEMQMQRVGMPQNHSLQYPIGSFNPRIASAATQNDEAPENERMTTHYHNSQHLMAAVGPLNENNNAALPNFNEITSNLRSQIHNSSTSIRSYSDTQNHNSIDGNRSQLSRQNHNLQDTASCISPSSDIHGIVNVFNQYTRVETPQEDYFTTADPIDINQALLDSHYQQIERQKACAVQLKNILTVVFKCCTLNCCFYTDEDEEMLRHLETHPGELQICAYCESFLDRDNGNRLVEHINMYHKNDQFQCGQCFYRTESIIKMAVHFMMEHHRKNGNNMTNLVIYKVNGKNRRKMAPMVSLKILKIGINYFVNNY